MSWHGSESEFEWTTVQRLKGLGYAHIHGSDLRRPHEEVVLRDRLRAFLTARYGRSVTKPDGLSEGAIEQAVAAFARPEGVDTIRRNMGFHTALTRGVEIQVEEPAEGGGDGRARKRVVTCTRSTGNTRRATSSWS